MLVNVRRAAVGVVLVLLEEEALRVHHAGDVVVGVVEGVVVRVGAGPAGRAVVPDPDQLVDVVRAPRVLLEEPVGPAADLDDPGPVVVVVVRAVEVGRVLDLLDRAAAEAVVGDGRTSAGPGGRRRLSRVWWSGGHAHA